MESWYYRIKLIALILGFPWMISAQQCHLEQLDIDTYLYSNDGFGQSFIPCDDGLLYQVDIPSHSFIGEEIQAIFRVYEGEGMEGPVIYETPITLDADWGVFFIHTLTEPLALESQSVYTYGIDFLGEFGAIWANFSDADPYGQLYWNGAPQPTIDMGYVLHMIVEPSPACYLWNGSSSNQWSDAANWTPSGIPDSTDCVIIEPLLGTHPDYPTITSEARAGDLQLLPMAELGLSAGHSLTVFGDLIVQGEASFKGLVILKNPEGTGVLGGQPVFDHLKIEGLQFLTEDIAINDILDVEEGQLFNLGSELYLSRCEEYLGHVYMPESSVQGRLTYALLNEDLQGDLVASPFHAADLDIQGLDSVHAYQQMAYDEGVPTPQWTGSDKIDRGAALTVSTSVEEKSYLSGTVSNSDFDIHSQVGFLGEEAIGFRMIGNPFPSHIDLREIQKSGEALPAIYRWNKDKLQYGAWVGGMSTADSDPFLAPLQAFAMVLPNGEQLHLDYKEMAVKPNVLKAGLDVPTVMPELKLHVSTASGEDEVLFDHIPDGEGRASLKKSAYKIASPYLGVPTLALEDTQGQFFSILSSDIPSSSSIPLAFSCGEDGFAQFGLRHIELAAPVDQVWLEDRKEAHFHDLVSAGDYQTQVRTSDERGRFVLHFGSPQEEPTPSPALSSELLDDGGQLEPQITAYQNLIRIQTEIEAEPLPISTRIEVIDMAGRVVHARTMRTLTDRIELNLDVNSALYTVVVRTPIETYTEKLWID